MIVIHFVDCFKTPVNSFKYTGWQFQDTGKFILTNFSLCYTYVDAETKHKPFFNNKTFIRFFLILQVIAG